MHKPFHFDITPCSRKHMSRDSKCLIRIRSETNRGLHPKKNRFLMCRLPWQWNRHQGSDFHRVKQTFYMAYPHHLWGVASVGLCTYLKHTSLTLQVCGHIKEYEKRWNDKLPTKWHVGCITTFIHAYLWTTTRTKLSFVHKNVCKTTRAIYNVCLDFVSIRFTNFRAPTYLSSRYALNIKDDKQHGEFV